ncbi:MAG TPA: response regulator transcription factor [Anaerolineae bacterium]|nr:response regulator transcription factor [Anaerolineae bacterium]
MTVRPEILVVDDEPRIRRFLHTNLELAGFAAIEAEDGLTALRLFEQHALQLVVLDIGLRGEMDGFQVLERIRQISDTPVIMLTARTAEDDKVRAFELGADDYLTKPFGSRELSARVKAVMRRSSRRGEEPASMIRVGDLHIDLASRQVSIGERPVKLSRTEFNLLVELARYPNRVLTHGQLLSQVWGSEYREDVEILRATIWRLRQRIEPDARTPQYILSEPGVGYLLVGD